MHFELNLPASQAQMSEDDFFEFCRQNPDLKFERNSTGQIFLGMPKGGNTGNLNSKFSARLQLWSETDCKGLAFDSSTGFLLPNGATRSPDASWISLEKWNRLTEKDKKRFPPLCPDFVLEICSENDSFRELREKVKEYMENGTRLAWLVDPLHQKASIFEAGKPVREIIGFDHVLLGEPVLAGFSFDLAVIKY